MRPEILADHLATVIRGLMSPLDGEVKTLAAAFGELRAQVAILEARAPIQGPPGPQGPEGPAGRAGDDGKGLSYLGVHVAGKSYDTGDLVTDDGSVFYCARPTSEKPGTSHDWQLMVKRGRDARRGTAMILETLENAKVHLNITDPADDAKVMLYLEHASALIVDYLGAFAKPEWDETTAPAVVQAAVLKMLAHLYEHRGDAIGTATPDQTIWEAISLLLMRSRDPALA